MLRIALPGLAVALVLSTFTGPVSAQDVSVPQEYGVVQQFVNAAYPDLAGRKIAIRFTRQGSDVLVQVAPSRSELSGTAIVSAAPLLSARVHFTEDMRLQRFTVDGGTFVSAAKNAALRDIISSNSTLSDDALRIWLSTAGGTYGPTGSLDVSGRMRPTGWRVLLGQAPGVWDLRFQWREFSPSGLGAAQPGWVAMVGAIDAAGLNHNYRLRFEPFSGQLVELEVE